MRLVQSRLVTDDVIRLAGFYAELLGASVPLNEYYVEVPAGQVSVGFSKRQFAGCPRRRADCSDAAAPRRASILDFQAADVDAECERVDSLGVSWEMQPTTQPWGTRAMQFADPDGNLVNVFSPSRTAG